MPLSMVNQGQDAILNCINWGPKLKKKLRDMGLTPGVKINVISNDTKGAFIINLRGSRLVLGSVVAQQIMVDLA
ncbi:ferrous iron transport protein A [Crassaminicella thermophila]|uniref:Ferrous iron transport protein A n=1 Tax=Crassaminicella thermophila TaxID=2599308 RepID=A0A5C0SGK5_CRATE|nr:FeoA family protein [Crassaminicella thermophila]QEK13330.1 ferrous iron transport protein A [Crassaminicella thermophila]